MKRMLILAAACLCLAGAAHAQSASKKYDWNDKNFASCMEPYAPAVPKPEDTSLKEMIEVVKPEVQAFIDESNRYLECLSLQMAKAQEARDAEKIKTLVKAHNDNVSYQQSVAAEFNATLQVLKQQAGQAVAGQAGDAPASGGEEATAPEAEPKAGEGATAEAAGSGDKDKTEKPKDDDSD